MARQLEGASGAGDELLDVVVIGGSQAGLAMAWHLARQHPVMRSRRRWLHLPLRSRPGAHRSTW